MTQDVKEAWPGSVVLLWPNGRSQRRQRQEAAESQSREDALETLRQALWSGPRLGHSIVNASQDCIEVLDLQGHLQFANPIALGLFGYPSPDEQGDVLWRASWPQDLAVTIVATLSIAKRGTTARLREWRPTVDGERRFWDVVVSPMTDERGTLLGLLAVSRDMTDLRRIEENAELRRRELSHQLKNVFTLVNGLITLSARRIPVVQPFARTLRDRFLALDRALSHLYRRPEAVEEEGPQTVQGLLRTLLTPYDGGGSAERRFTFAGAGDAPLGRSSTTSLALVIHELATNAVKHGALSRDGGVVSVTCRRDGGDLRLTWSESGGPAIEAPPEQTGFGSDVMERSVTGQLGGTIERNWNPDGLLARITLSKNCLAR